MRPGLREDAELVRSRLSGGSLDGAGLRAALLRVPPLDRDAFLNVVFDLEELPDDTPALPRGCVPYLPCPVDTLFAMLELAQVRSSDVFVDLGAGAGRAIVLARLLTGATAIGVEIQPSLAGLARALASRMHTAGVSVVDGDAAELVDPLRAGSVFFLYCPFGGERLTRVLGSLEEQARRRPIRVCCVDLPLPPCPWLRLVAPPQGGLEVYESAAPALAE